MVTFLIGLIFLALIIVSIAIVLQKDLATTVVLFMGFGLGSTMLYFIFSAPDVALTEAVIGAGMSGVVLFTAILKTEQKSKGSL